ncbi:hypothetical protein V7150_16070 [Neobacillus drentensis]
MTKVRVFEKEIEGTEEKAIVELTNEVQISAFVNEGFKEVKKDKPKK